MRLDHAVPLQQSAIFADALRLCGREVTLLSPRGAQAVAIRRAPFPALVSRGPLWKPSLNTACKISALKALARQGVRLINAETPEDAPVLHRAGFRRIVTGAHVGELDLTLPPEALRAAMHGKFRNRLRRAEAEVGTRRIVHRPFCATRDRWLIEAEAAQQKARRYRGFPPAFVAAMSQIAPGDLRLFALMHAGKPLAAMLFVIHGRCASYHIGWAGTEGRRLGAHNLLLWNAMRHLPEQGISLLDLGTIDTDTAPGLARFKLGSGARPRVLGGTWARLRP